MTAFLALDTTGLLFWILCFSSTGVSRSAALLDFLFFWIRGASYFGSSHCHIASVLGLLYIPPRPLQRSFVVAYLRLVCRGVVSLDTGKMETAFTLLEHVATGAIWYILMAE
jgi:hypothetical protein